MLIATVTTQRSGSKLLANCFASGTQVRPYGEVFNPDRWIVGSYKAFLAAYAAELQPLSGDQIMDRYFAAFGRLAGEDREAASSRISHFDVMFNQIEIPCPTWNPFDSYFIYGYLRSRRAVVISLDRAPKDIFVSMKYLEISNRPHVLKGEAAEEPVAEDLTLDLDEYRRFAKSIERHRSILARAMASYEYFVRLGYEELAEQSFLPGAVRDVIVRAAREHGIPINPAFIQIHDVRVRPTGVDYARVFNNLHELE